MTMDVLLVLHGTKASALTPSAVVATAESDLRRRRRNERLRAERKDARLSHRAPPDGVAELYTFTKVTVETAKSVHDLLCLAINERGMLIAKVQAWEIANATLPPDKRKKCPHRAETVRVYFDQDALLNAAQLTRPE